MLIAASFGRAKCPSAGKWINKFWYNHPRDGCSATKRKGLLMKENNTDTSQRLTLSERSQTQRTTYICFHFYEILEKAKLTDTGSRSVAAWARGGGWGLSAEGTWGFLAGCSPNWTGDVVLKSFFTVLGFPLPLSWDSHTTECLMVIKSAVEFFFFLVLGRQTC